MSKNFKAGDRIIYSNPHYLPREADVWTRAADEDRLFIRLDGAVDPILVNADECTLKGEPDATR